MKPLKLVVGLGNPGKAYTLTRHNIGFMTIDHMASTFHIGLDKKKFSARFGRGAIEGCSVILAKPLAYMNRSGIPTSQLARYFRISCNDLIVIHDDIDLAFGRLKIKQKGGSGGHKGIQSLREAFGDDGFTRIRMGVGRPEPDRQAADHVLSEFNSDERRILDQVIVGAREAVMTILREGTEVAMNCFNGLNMLSSG